MMHIKWMRSGGFVSVILRGEIDSRDLSAADQRFLAALVAAARRVPIASGTSVPDDFLYDLMIDSERRLLHESELTPEWAALVEWLLTYRGAQSS